MKSLLGDFRGSVILNAEKTHHSPRRILIIQKRDVPYPSAHSPIARQWIAVDKLSSRLATLIYNIHIGGISAFTPPRMTNAGSHLIISGRKHAIIIVLAHAYIHGFPTSYRFVEIADIICIFNSQVHPGDGTNGTIGFQLYD
jgi:hypothetical protein